MLHVVRAYRDIEEADAAVGHGRCYNAAPAYQPAMALETGIAELKAWASVALLQMGQEREAMGLFETAFRASPGLVDLLRVALVLLQVNPAAHRYALVRRHTPLVCGSTRRSSFLSPGTSGGPLVSRCAPTG